ncbi:MAG: deoxyribose-phosphate aldolase [Erysipelotrichaceae bacterium]|nr:deoxyribose-phosphate aldolase [Erysipelotrichaceae bacterium]
MLKVEELEKMIDQTLLKPYVTDEELITFANEVKKYNFKTAAINNAPVETIKHVFEDTDILLDAAISFPLGQATIEAKVFEAQDVIDKGAGEIDYVVNVGKLKSKDYDYVLKEMKAMVEVCHKNNRICKVIFENCYLTDDEKRKLCEIALQTDIDFIKTSTGFGPSGATIDDVKLMKECVQDKIKIKAAGGIRSAEDALAFIEAGASRIGTSAGPKIIEEYKMMLYK